MTYMYTDDQNGGNISVVFFQVDKKIMIYVH